MTKQKLENFKFEQKGKFKELLLKWTGEKEENVNVVYNGHVNGNLNKIHIDIVNPNICISVIIASWKNLFIDHYEILHIEDNKYISYVVDELTPFFELLKRKRNKNAEEQVKYINEKIEEKVIANRVKKRMEKKSITGGDPIENVLNSKDIKVASSCNKTNDTKFFRDIENEYNKILAQKDLINKRLTSFIYCLKELCKDQNINISLNKFDYIDIYLDGKILEHVKILNWEYFLFERIDIVDHPYTGSLKEINDFIKIFLYTGFDNNYNYCFHLKKIILELMKYRAILVKNFIDETYGTIIDIFESKFIHKSKDFSFDDKYMSKKTELLKNLFIQYGINNAILKIEDKRDVYIIKSDKNKNLVCVNIAQEIIENDRGYFTGITSLKDKDENIIQREKYFDQFYKNLKYQLEHSGFTNQEQEKQKNYVDIKKKIGNIELDIRISENAKTPDTVIMVNNIRKSYKRMEKILDIFKFDFIEHIYVNIEGDNKPYLVVVFKNNGYPRKFYLYQSYANEKCFVMFYKLNDENFNRLLRYLKKELFGYIWTHLKDEFVEKIFDNNKDLLNSLSRNDFEQDMV